VTTQLLPGNKKLETLALAGRPRQDAFHARRVICQKSANHSDHCNGAQANAMRTSSKVLKHPLHERDVRLAAAERLSISIFLLGDVEHLDDAVVNEH